MISWLTIISIYDDCFDDNSNRKKKYNLTTKFAGSLSQPNSTLATSAENHDKVSDTGNSLSNNASQLWAAVAKLVPGKYVSLDNINKQYFVINSFLF